MISSRIGKPVIMGQAKQVSLHNLVFGRRIAFHVRQWQKEGKAMRNKLMTTTLLTSILVALLFVTAGHVSAQQPSMISDLTVEADRSDYVGPCPRDIHLTGKFQVNEAGLGLASVQFVHSDGILENGALLINDKRVYTFEVNLRRTNSWSEVVFLRVTVSLSAGPQQFDSSRITIKGNCRFAQIVNPTERVAVLPTRATGHFRVTLTGFTVNQQTLEGPTSIDGAGDEVFVMVNSAEVGPANIIFGPLESRQSLRYGDTSGLGSHTIPRILHAGRASDTGGLQTNDAYPPPGVEAETWPSADAATRARLIPMVLWDGYLRRGAPLPNAAIIIPTIWENDNNEEVLNIWNRQVDTYLRRLASTSGGLFTGEASRKLLVRTDTVLSTIPQVLYFDRPIGMEGDTFNPLAAVRLPATFVPAVMFLTYDNAEEAASGTSNSGGRGVVEITYRDGRNYGAGSYTIFLLVERLR